MRVAGLLVALALLAACAPAAPGPGARDPTPSEASPSEESPSGSPLVAPEPSPSPTTTTPSQPRPSISRTSISRIGPDLRRRMGASHRAGCPVSLADLRYLRVPYVDFRGRARTGELVVHREQAEGVVQVFEALRAARFPIERMVLVDEYDGDDDRSMAANNTAAYNCRPVAGTSRWSEHAYGAAIDLNPVQNPYVTGSDVAPPAGVDFADLDRSSRADVPPGVIRADDVVVRAFARIGWSWGGVWTSSKDYQHFSASGS